MTLFVCNIDPAADGDGNLTGLVVLLKYNQTILMSSITNQSKLFLSYLLHEIFDKEAWGTGQVGS